MIHTRDRGASRSDFNIPSAWASIPLIMPSTPARMIHAARMCFGKSVYLGGIVPLVGVGLLSDRVRPGDPLRP